MRFKMNYRIFKTSGTPLSRSFRLRSSMLRIKLNWHSRNLKKYMQNLTLVQIRATVKFNSIKSDNLEKKLKCSKRMVRNLRTQFEDFEKKNKSLRTLLTDVKKR